jgi:drug/metabolite transporter (DMT)-like permease
MTTSRAARWGMPIMAVSSVLFSAMSLLIPLTRSVNTSLVASARFVTGIVVILGLALAGFTRIKPVNRWWLIVRGLIGATSVYFFYRGITNLGLGKGTVLNYTYPVFAALLAPLMLKEKLSWDVVAAVLVSFVGIALVVNPGRLDGIGVEELLALLGGVLSGVAVVAIKKLRETDTPSVIYLAQCLFGLLVVGWPTITSPFGFSGQIWLILLGIGVLATAAQFAMTWAYKHVPATEGSLLGFLVPVLNVLLGVIVFGEKMRISTVAGSALVLICCGYVAFRERILRLVG